MTMKTLLGAAALASTTASPLAAVPINLDFSFGGVSGTFYGLDNADGVAAATSLDFAGLADDYIGIDLTRASSNAFGFADGALISVDIVIIGNQVGTAGTGSFGHIYSTPSFGYLTSVSSESSRGPLSGLLEADGRTTFTQQPLSAVPLPAGGLLLLSGLAGIAGLKRRKKHIA